MVNKKISIVFFGVLDLLFTTIFLVKKSSISLSQPSQVDLVNSHEKNNATTDDFEEEQWTSTNEPEISTSEGYVNKISLEEVKESVLGIEIGKKQIITIKQQIQETNYYCVPATVQMLLDHYGFYVSQEMLASQMNTRMETGTEYEDLAKTVNSYLFNKELVSEDESGYHVQTINEEQGQEIAELFEKRIRTNIDTGYPSFVAVDLYHLYSNMPKANHMVLVVGYATHKESEKIAIYYIIDPYPKT